MYFNLDNILVVKDYRQYHVVSHHVGIIGSLVQFPLHQKFPEIRKQFLLVISDHGEPMNTTWLG